MSSAPLLNPSSLKEVPLSFVDEITTRSAIDLAALLRQRAVSCVEVVEAFLTKIDDIDPQINAFCTLAREEALAAAARADRISSADPLTLGVLHGVPVALKDLTPTSGIRTTRGSRLFEHVVPSEDAILVERLKAAGAIILGKTNTPEFGHKGETDNLVFGPTRNPWRLDRTAGGSSGGSAAAVAAGLIPFAEGSDGAGSIRIPASMCGVFGFKPTYGRVPDVAGAFSSHSPFFHNGPIARSVSDACLLYQTMAGAHPADPFSLPTDDDVFADLEKGISRSRVAFSPDLGLFPVSQHVRSTCSKAAEVFEQLGCEVAEMGFSLNADTEQAFMILWCCKLAMLYGDLPECEFDLLEPVVQDLIEQGRRLSAVEIGRANVVRETVWHELCRLFLSHDLLICPTTAVPAFPIDSGPPKMISGKEVNPLLGWFLTYPFNLTGNPVASIPCGVSPDGMPIGLQIVGRRLDDALVLRASRAFEKAMPWPRLVSTGR